MSKKRKLPSRLYASVKDDIERDQRQALVECITVGLPAMVERYGHHSMEVRGLEHLVAKLTAGPRGRN